MILNPRLFSGRASDYLCNHLSPFRIKACLLNRDPRGKVLFNDIAKNSHLGVSKSLNRFVDDDEHLQMLSFSCQRGVQHWRCDEERAVPT